MLTPVFSKSKLLVALIILCTLLTACHQKTQPTQLQAKPTELVHSSTSTLAPNPTIIRTLIPTYTRIPTSTQTPIPTPTPTRTLSPAEQLERQMDAIRSADWETIGPTVMSIFSECGRTSYRGYYTNGTWGAILCEGYMTGVYNLDNPSIAWRIRYEDLFGADYVKNAELLGAIRPIHWSADGLYLYLTPDFLIDGGCPVYLDGDFLLRLNLTSGQIIQILTTSEVEGINNYYNISFSHDDQYMAYLRTWLDHPILNLRNLNTSEEQHIDLGNQFTDAGDVVWSPDQSKIVFSARNLEDCHDMTAYLVMLDLNDFSQTILFERTDQIYYPIEWTDNNTIILSKRHSPEYFSFDLDTGEMTLYLLPTPTMLL